MEERLRGHGVKPVRREGVAEARWVLAWNNPKLHTPDRRKTWLACDTHLNPIWKLRYFDEIDKYRGHDMQALYDPETAGIRWLSPAYNTGAAKLTYTATSRVRSDSSPSSASRSSR